ncbi:hypothetical protein D3C80_1790570 [compost metagenome]
MFGNARWYGILLMQRGEIDSIGLVQKQGGEQFFLRWGKSRQIKISYQIGGMNGRLFEINAQTHFMQRTGADEQILT